MIPTFVQQIIGTVVRAALVWLAAWLATRHVTISDSQVLQLAAWATPLLAALAWSVWQKYGARQKQLVAQTMRAGVTEAQVESRLANGPAPSVLTPKNEQPS